MSGFRILQIGDDIDPAAGIPEGCDLCGHCRFLRHSSAGGTPLPCGGRVSPSRDIGGTPHSRGGEGIKQPDRPADADG